MKGARRSRSRKGAGPREPASPATEGNEGKETISQENHASNVGQRADDSQPPREIHPDDHEDG